MSLSVFANTVLLLALGCILLAAAGDTIATRQMATERYRFVPFIRTLRRAHGAAAFFALAFGVVSMAVSPVWSVVALLVGFLFAMLGQFRMLACGGNFQAWLRGFQPALVLGMLAVHFPGLLPQDQPQLQLSHLALGAAVLVAFGSWYVAFQRTQQDLLRLRD